MASSIDHLPNSSSEDRIMQLTRRTSAEVYAFIESDLTMLLLLYLINQYIAEGASKRETYALLARVNLYQKKSGKSN
jgi:hypothetical protein